MNTMPPVHPALLHWAKLWKQQNSLQHSSLDLVNGPNPIPGPMSPIPLAPLALTTTSGGMMLSPSKRTKKSAFSPVSPKKLSPGQDIPSGYPTGSLQDFATSLHFLKMQQLLQSPPYLGLGQQHPSKMEDVVKNDCDGDTSLLEMNKEGGLDLSVKLGVNGLSPRGNMEGSRKRPLEQSTPTDLQHSLTKKSGATGTLSSKPKKSIEVSRIFLYAVRKLFLIIRLGHLETD